MYLSGLFTKEFKSTIWATEGRTIKDAETALMMPRTRRQMGDTSIGQLVKDKAAKEKEKEKVDKEKEKEKADKAAKAKADKAVLAAEAKADKALKAKTQKGTPLKLKAMSPKLKAMSPVSRALHKAASKKDAKAMVNADKKSWRRLALPDSYSHTLAALDAHEDGSHNDELMVEVVASFLVYSVFTFFRGHRPLALEGCQLQRMLLELDDELLDTHDRMQELRCIWARDLAEPHAYACIAFVRVFLTRFVDIEQVVPMLVHSHPVGSALELGDLAAAFALIDEMHKEKEKRPKPGCRFVPCGRWTVVDFPLAARHPLLKLANTQSLSAPLPAHALKEALLKPEAGKEKKGYTFMPGFNWDFFATVAMRSAEYAGGGWQSNALALISDLRRHPTVE